MNNLKLLLITIILFIISICISSSNTTFFSTKANIKIKNNNGNIESLNLEDYVIGVVAAEMPASFNDEALKAQAVASRTYAMYKMKHNNKDYDVVTNVSNQSYISIDEMKIKWQDDFYKYFNKIKDAVNATKNEVMLYNNEVIEAFYYAMSNGYGETSLNVFNEDLDYIDNVLISYDNDSIRNFIYKTTISKSDFCNKLNIDCNDISIKNIIKNDSNRVSKITINNEEFDGIKIRKLLNLRSTDFNIDIENDNMIITTRGYGHGVGMSQYGANGMAKDGMNYKEILNYFYKNVIISSI